METNALVMIGSLAPIRVGVFAFTKPESGGIYQYTRSVIAALQACRPDIDSIVLYTDQSWDNTDLFDASGGKNWHCVSQPAVRRAVSRLALTIAQRVIGSNGRSAPLSPYRTSILRHGLDLIFYPSPIRVAYEVGIPYLVTVHDMQHRLQPEFAEVSTNARGRDRVYQRCSEKALGVIVPSEVGGDDLRAWYGVEPHKVHVLPPVPADYLSRVRPTNGKALLARYRIPERFLFYPAQFWVHKNHLGILKALALLRMEEGLDVPVVFAGAKKSGFTAVMNSVSDLGLTDLVTYVGYLPNEDMAGFYTSAQALVMPSFFGPTNVPIVEAFQLGCPVITSPARGIPEQTGDAAIMVDPRSPRDIAHGIRRVWDSAELRADLRERGLRRIAAWTQQDFTERLMEIIQRAASTPSVASV